MTNEELDEFAIIESAVLAVRAMVNMWPEDDNLIRVWRYEDAPKELRALSRHGVDEDWLVLIPPSHCDYISWIEGGNFGVCSVSTHNLHNGYIVKIGAHA